MDLEDDVAATVPRYGATKRIVSHHDFAKTPSDIARLHTRLAALDAGGAPSGSTIRSVEAKLPVTGRQSPGHRLRKCR